MPTSPASQCKILVHALEAYAEALRSHSLRLNSINVFPAPDFDTGSNLQFTVLDALAQLQEVSDWTDIAPAITRGSLMGARGNCGVLLSQFLRGLSHALAAGASIRESLSDAERGARSAVMRPVEGTFLTIARVVADVRPSATSDDQYIVAAANVAAEAVRVTNRQLILLNEAAVFDAGAGGLSLLIDAWATAIADFEPPYRSVVILEGNAGLWTERAQKLCDSLESLVALARGEALRDADYRRRLCDGIEKLLVWVTTCIPVESELQAEDVAVVSLLANWAQAELKESESPFRRPVADRIEEALDRAADRLRRES